MKKLLMTRLLAITHKVFNEKLNIYSCNTFLKRLRNQFKIHLKFNDSFVPAYCKRAYQNVALCC